MADSDEFFVRFWGTRGSIACPDKEYQRYGGNTSCLEVRCGGRLLILDAGTGLRSLGSRLQSTPEVAAESKAPGKTPSRTAGGNGQDPHPGLTGDILLTHTHYDHIMGLPFFGPLFDPRNRFRIWAGHLDASMSLHDALCRFMHEPLFPVPPAIFNANVTFHDFIAGDTLSPGSEIVIRTAPLNHPDLATGYRIEYAGRALCYVTDTEHVEGKPDREILGLIEGADLVIYDSSYTDEEFPRYRTWGHSTWQEGVRLCEQAGAERLVIFHHDPSHDDTFMDAVAEAAKQARPGTVVATEGLVLHP